MEKWKIHNYGIEAIFHQIFDDFGREFLHWEDLERPFKMVLTAHLYDDGAPSESTTKSRRFWQNWTAPAPIGSESTLSKTKTCARWVSWYMCNLCRPEWAFTASLPYHFHSSLSNLSLPTLPLSFFFNSLFSLLSLSSLSLSFLPSPLSLLSLSSISLFY